MTIEFVAGINRISSVNSRIEKSVDDSILTFLQKCYSSIPYRKGNNYTRNIAYIVRDDYRNIEDIFLLFYRFIECYYRSQKIQGINYSFIQYSILNNYRKHNIKFDVDMLANQIRCLRNHYAHSGYHLRNNSLRIVYNRRNKPADPRNYTEQDIDYKWIAKRTRILYEISIDIIFRSVLGYDAYDYDHFLKIYK